MKHLPYIFFAAACLFLSYGCGLSTACESTSDCFQGEQCIDSECVTTSIVDNDVSDQDAAGPDTSGPGDPDVANPDPDVAVHDAGGDASNNDAASDDVVVEPSVCLGDPFASCEDRGEDRVYNSKGDAIFPPRDGTSAGCVIRGNEFVAFDGTFEGTLCTNEPADWYRFTLLACDDVIVLAEFRIALDNCPTSVMESEVHLGNNRLECESADLSCTVEDGDVVYRFRVPDSRSQPFTAYLGIIKTHDAGRFDYTVHYRVYH